MGGLFELPSAVITSADVLRLMSFVSVGTLYDSNPRDVERATVVFCRFALFRTFWPAFFSETMLAYLHLQNPPLTTPPFNRSTTALPILQALTLVPQSSTSKEVAATTPQANLTDTSYRQTHQIVRHITIIIMAEDSSHDEFYVRYYVGVS